jgi:taurine dioxygenase
VTLNQGALGTSLSALGFSALRHESFEAAISIAPISPFVGAGISGVDISKPIGEQTKNDLERALSEYGVIVFRDQTLTPEEHVAFARQFGEIDVNRFFKPVAGYPMIAEVRKEADQKANIGGGWHTDHSYDQVPAKASFLYARQVPKAGGDTLFTGLYAAYDALSPAFKTMLGSLKAVHSSRHVFGRTGKLQTGTDLPGRVLNPDLATQDAVHPLVFTHPVNGRKALYVNPGFTVGIAGWSTNESHALLSYLYDHIKQPEFSCRIRWQEGSLAIWDNRSTWHLALNDYSGESRLMHRVTIAGEPLN